MLSLFTQIAETSGGCTVNGQPASCGSTLGIIALIMIPLFLILGILFVIWIISLVHLVKHEDVPNRVVWLILMFVGAPLLAALIYFFAVKRGYDREHKAANVPVSPVQPPVEPPQPPVPPVVPPTQPPTV